MVEIEREAGVPYVVLTGDFNVANVAEFESALAGFDSETPVVVDLEAVTFLDSTVVNVLVRRHKGSNGNLILIVPAHAKIRRLFELANLTGYLRIVASREAAASARPASSA